MPIRSQLDTSMYKGMGGSSSLGDILGLVNGVMNITSTVRDRKKQQREDDDVKYINEVTGKYMQGYNGTDASDLYQRKQGAYNEILQNRPDLNKYVSPMQEEDVKNRFTADKNALDMQRGQVNLDNDKVTLDSNKQILQQNQRKTLDDETKRQLDRSMEAAGLLADVRDNFGFRKIVEQYPDILSNIAPTYEQFTTSTEPATVFWRDQADKAKRMQQSPDARAQMALDDRNLKIKGVNADINKVNSEAVENYANAAKLKDDPTKSTKRQDMFLAKIDSTLRNDQFVKHYTDQLGYAGNTVSLLMSDNPVANQAAKTQLARLSGEVGVLTDADVSRFGGSKAVLSRAKQAAQEALSGKLTEENRQFLLSVAQRFEENARLKLDERLGNLAQGQSQAFGIPYENIQPLVQSYGSNKIANVGTQNDQSGGSTAANDLALIRARRAVKNGQK